MLLRSSLVKIARRNCHHFTPDNPLPRTVLRSIPDTFGKRKELMNTVQKQQKEIKELNNKLTKLTEDTVEQIEHIKDDMRLGYSLSCLLVVFSVAIRT
jgi:hypothetical protein